MQYQINPSYQSKEKQLLSIVSDFDKSGEDFVIGNRNVVKSFDLEGVAVIVKSFKKPNLINKFAYKYIRSSKAQRSFEHANKLLTLGIGTPNPIGFFQFSNWFGIQQSYYFSEFLPCDFTFRELVDIPDFPDRKNAVLKFIDFCFQLHEKGVEFLDHSPGNTLIVKKDSGVYDFSLVDLNRMNFHEKMSLDLRMKNLSHLTPHKEMMKWMAEEYAKIGGYDAQETYGLLIAHSDKFIKNFTRRQKFKKFKKRVRGKA